MGQVLLRVLCFVVFDWIVLVVTIRVAQGLASIQLPPWGQMAWKMAVIVLAESIASVGVGLLLGSVVGLIAGIVVFWVVMFKVFDVDPWPLLVVIMFSKVVSWFLLKLVATGVGLVIT